MKRIKLYVAIASICSFSLVSCGNDVPENPTHFSVVDLHKGYVVGDVYADTQELVASIITNNEREELISYDSLAIDITKKDDSSINIGHRSAFTEAGEYKVLVTYNSYNYNYNINVYDHPIYVTSIDISGPTEMDKRDLISLKIDVNPEIYTTSLDITTDKNDLVTIERNETGCYVYGNNAGTVEITVSSKNLLGLMVKDTHRLTINETPDIVNITQSFKTLTNSFTYYGSYAKSSCPLIGTPKVLVVPVWFNNSDEVFSMMYREDVREDIENAYFGSKESTGWHSVSSYYYEESQGRLDIQGTVTDWYEVDYSFQELGRDNTTIVTKLVKSAATWYFNNHQDDPKSNYDYDGDGYLDGIFLIYAAPDCRQEGYEEYGNLWGYTYWTFQKNSSPTNIIPNAFFWASYDFIYGEASAIARTGVSFYQGDTSFCNVDAHCFIHEMGHVFGANDYYDYSKQYQPAGGFSMQDWNVGGHDPYSVMTMGWGDPYIPTESGIITIGAFQETHDMILLTPEWNEYNSPFDEYLLLELYTPTGLNAADALHHYGLSPQGPLAIGVRLWHVDARLIKNGTSSFFNDASVRGCEIAMKNAYYTNGNVDYITSLGRTYANFNELQLIRNDIEETYQPTNTLEADDLFYSGDTFTMEKYASQFYRKGKLNSRTDLGWTFKVKKIYGNLLGHVFADIQVTRL